MSEIKLYKSVCDLRPKLIVIAANFGATDFHDVFFLCSVFDKKWQTTDLLVGRIEHRCIWTFLRSRLPMDTPTAETHRCETGADSGNKGTG